MTDNSQLQNTNLFGNNLIKLSLDDLETGCDIVLSMGLIKVQQIMEQAEMPEEIVLKAINTGVNISKHIAQRVEIERKAKDGMLVFDNKDLTINA